MKLTLIILLSVLSLFYLIRKKWQQKKLLNLLDEIIAAGLVNLIFIGLGFLFKEEIYNFFQRPKITMASSCIRTENDRKYIWDCKITVKNSGESALAGHKFVLSSSKTVSNFNFTDCSPRIDVKEDDQDIVSDSKEPGLSDCKFKAILRPFGKLSFNMYINGDSHEPDPEVLQP